MMNDPEGVVGLRSAAWHEGRDAVTSAWRELDPVFVMGMQRSGTSILAMAMHAAGLRGFAEGHLWHELVATLDQVQDRERLPELRLEPFALGQGRDADLARYLALAIDRFHRHHVPDIQPEEGWPEPQRWYDKTPGSEAVVLAPRLAAMFPRAQFLFVHRDGAATVNSGMRLWPDTPDIFHVMCRDWAKTMSTWLEVRGTLGERALELPQADIARNPAESARVVADFLGLPEQRETIAALFAGRRENSAFPERAPGDYRLELDWTEGQKTRFARVCGPQMKVWGYAMPFRLQPWPLRLARRARDIGREEGAQGIAREGLRFLRWQRDRAIHRLRTGKTL
jgi:hypothetical protein